MNIVIGTLVVIAFHLLESTNLGESTINTFFDKFITKESLEAAEVDISLETSGIVFVDIDHKTYIEWGEPLITPRDKLAEIIELAYMQKPKLIVLDILLENPDSNKDNDRKLRDVLRNILKDGNNTNTRIIFSSRIGYDKNMEKEILKKTIVDDLIMSAENIAMNGDFKKFYPASPYTSRSTSDYVERYWNLYETYTDKNGKKRILWGLPLLAAILSNQREMTCLEKFKRKIIDSKETFTPGPVEVLEFPNGKKIKLPVNKSDIYLQRIRFLLVPDNKIEHKNGNLLQIVEGYSRLSKYYRSKEGEKEYYLKRFFEDKIVVIGNSSPDTGDIHRTPVGDLPGLYVIGNAIDTLVNLKQPTPPPIWINFLIEFVIILIAAYVFLYFNSFFAKVLVSLVIIIVFGYFSRLYFLEYGIFLNFVFGAAAIGFLETSISVLEIIEKRSIKKQE